MTLLVVVIVGLQVGLTLALEGYCSADDVTCGDHLDIKKFRLRKIMASEPGYSRDITLENGKKTKLKTLSLMPQLFEIPDFISAREADLLVKIAKRQGLKAGQTQLYNPEYDFSRFDYDNSGSLDEDEMRVVMENQFDVFFDEYQIFEMYKALKMDWDEDGTISRRELEGAFKHNFDKWVEYVEKTAAEKPYLKSRWSNVTFLFPDLSMDAVVANITKRIAKLVELPYVLVNKSDIQIVHYARGGHYNAHVDSSRLSDDMKCCKRFAVDNNVCRSCRFLTLLMYLNEVPEGGHTVFPAANILKFDVMEAKMTNMFELSTKCSSTYPVKIKPKKGKAILWYNHYIDNKSGWLGEMDKHSYHGSCPVTKGEKWVANFWVKLTADKAKDLVPNIYDPTKEALGQY